MQEANVRALDTRQTLPNLKSLFLALSSPSPHRMEALSRGTTYVNSTASSRTTSYNFGGSTLPSAITGMSPAGSSTAGKQSPPQSTRSTRSKVGINGSPLAMGRSRMQAMKFSVSDKADMEGEAGMDSPDLEKSRRRVDASIDHPVGE